MKIFQQLIKKESKNESQYDCVKSKNLIKGKIDNPEYSFVIPTYKRLNQTLRAVKSCLNQTIKNIKYDVIVIDNEPNLSVEENQLYKELVNINDGRISYFINEENIGMVGNWNRCFKLSSAPWIILLHSDDIVVSTYLENIINIKDKFHFDIYYVNGKFIKDENEICTPIKGHLYKISLFDTLFGNLTTTSGCLFNREKVLSIGGFNNDYYPCIDYHFLVKSVHYLKVCKLSHILMYAFKGENETFNVIEKIIEYDYIIRKAISRSFKLKRIPEFIALMGNYNLAYYLPLQFLGKRLQYNIKNKLYHKEYNAYNIELLFYRAIRKIHSLFVSLKSHKI